MRLTLIAHRGGRHSAKANDGTRVRTGASTDAKGSEATSFAVLRQLLYVIRIGAGDPGDGELAPW